MKINLKINQEKITSFFSRQTVTTKELAIYTKQLAVLLNAGIPMSKLLEVLMFQAENPKLIQVTQNIQNCILNKGLTLSGSLQQQKDIFPPLYIVMVRCGEQSGALPKIMNELAEHLEHDAKMINQYKAALTYPLITLVVSVLSALIIVKFVFPGFVPIFKTFSLALPWPTRLLMAFNDLLNAWWFWPLIIVLIPTLTIWLKHYLKTKPGKNLKDSIISYIPVLNKVISKIILTRFCRVFSLLYANGYPILQSMQLLENVVDNSAYEKEIEDMSSHIKEGESVFEAIEKEPHFSKIIVNMISAGEEAGQLSYVLGKVSDYYEADTESFLENANKLFEPLIIIVLGFLIGFILLALIMPLYQMLGNFGV